LSASSQPRPGVAADGEQENSAERDLVIEGIQAKQVRFVPDQRDTWLEFTPAEREALATHDYVTLFELGAHNFLLLTLFIALFERDYAEPLAFQREFAVRLSDWSVPYPDTAT
jgi:hypothetical protein